MQSKSGVIGKNMQITILINFWVSVSDNLLWDVYYLKKNSVNNFEIAIAHSTSQFWFEVLFLLR